MHVPKTSYHAARLVGILVLLCGVALDQIHKAIMLYWVEMPLRPPIEVTSFFNLVMVWNPGISFGMFRDIANGPTILITLALVIVVWLLWWMWGVARRGEAAALGLIIGGALGNVVDRIRFGAVADFFDFHIANLHWPAFNIADSLVFMGAIGLMVYAFFPEQQETASQKDKPAEEEKG